MKQINSVKQVRIKIFINKTKPIESINQNKHKKKRTKMTELGKGGERSLLGQMDDLGFRVFSTVFQSYQDDGRLIMKGCMEGNPVYG